MSTDALSRPGTPVLRGAQAAPTATPVVMPVSKSIAWLGGATVLALLAYYFVGVDEGATSIFGHSMVVHEFVHDSRHFLGFPCH